MEFTIEKAAKGMKQLGYYTGALTSPSTSELKTAIANFARYENVLETTEVRGAMINVVPDTFASKIARAANEYEDENPIEAAPLEREGESETLVSQAGAALSGGGSWVWWALLGLAGLLLVGGFVAWARSKDEV